MPILGRFFKFWFSHSLLAALLLAGLAELVHAQNRLRDHLCIVCEKPPGTAETVWSFQKTNLICAACNLIPETCGVCGVPVKIGFVKTTDGRFYCSKDKVGRVFGEYEAGRIFIAATDELRRIAQGSMELREYDVPVNLFDVDYWNDAKRSRVNDRLHKVGVSHSRRVGDKFVHGVVVLSGQPAQTVAAVCAHEYTHLWLNENLPAGREIEPDVIEAICELAAWKLMQFRQVKEEMEDIRTNEYTRGRIADLLKLEAESGFEEILRWVRTGKGRVPPKALTKEDFVPPPTAKAPAVPLWTAAPKALDRLELQGLIGQSSKKSAVINGIVFFVGDERSVPVGSDRLKLRCLEISEKSVVVSTNATDRTELLLKARP